MAKRRFLSVPFVVALSLIAVVLVSGRFTRAQEDSTSIRVNVDLVQLNVAVTDNNGNYISGLGPENFAITEDKIPERVATFEEGNEPTRQVLQPPAGQAPAQGSAQPATKSKPVVVAAGSAQKSNSGPVGEDLATLPANVS